MKIYALTLYILFASLLLKAQLGINSQWTWMKGDSTTNSPGIYGTQGTSAGTSKPGARSAGVSWKDASGNLWLYGGGGYVIDSGFGQLNDLWKYQISTNQWTWVKGANTINNYGVYGTKGTADATNQPGARAGGVSWTDLAGDLWLFGGSGYGGSKPGYLNDLWRYSPSTSQWTWVSGDSIPDVGAVYGTQGIPDFGNTPGNRFGSVSWTDVSGNLWLFGGRGYPESGSPLPKDFNELWKYNPATNQWTFVRGDNFQAVYGTQGVASPGNQPGPGYSGVSWRDGSGNLWLFGGASYFVISLEMDNYNDLWKYDPVLNEWTWMKGDNTPDSGGVYGTRGNADAANKPGARDGAASWTDNTGNLWLFGGEVNYSTMEGTGVEGIFDDLWKYDPLVNQWAWEKGDNIPYNHGVYGMQNTPDAANNPGSRHDAVSWPDNFGNLWLFGGNGDANSGAEGRLSDLWKIGNNGALPVTLLNISAAVIQKDIVVKWQTSQEINTAYFTVERSTDGKNFVSIGSVIAAGNSSSGKNYSFPDQQPLPGTYYYRVRMTGNDGSYKNSPVVRVTLEGAQIVTVYPNPVISMATISLTTNANGELKFSLYDDKGSLVIVKQIFITTGNNSFTVDMTKLSKGSYTAVMIWANENKKVQILKN